MSSSVYLTFWGTQWNIWGRMDLRGYWTFSWEKDKSSKCFSYYQSHRGASSGLQKWAFPVVRAEWVSHSSRWETAAWRLLTRSQFCKAKHNRQLPAHRCGGKWSREGWSSLLRCGKGGAWNWGSLLHHTSLAEQDEEKAVLPFIHVSLIERLSTV